MAKTNAVTSKSAKEEKSAQKRPTPRSAQPVSSTLGTIAPAMAVEQAAIEPHAIHPADVIALQRKYGNRATQHLMGKSAIQAKLRVGAAHDAYEQEADRVAAQVMSTPASTPVVQRLAEEEEIQTKPLAASITPLVQRTATEEEEELQAKFIQRADALDEDEVQAKSVGAGAAFSPQADFEDRLATARGSGTSLPEATRDFMEARFGADFGNVRLHTGSEAAQLNRSISAQAFTHGSDIYLAEGQTDVESSAGRQLLAHELTHVVQQGAADVAQLPDTAHSEDGSAVQRKFVPARATGKAHLREEDTWGVHKGPAIPSGANLLVDDSDANVKVQHKTIGPKTRWRPAVNVPPNHLGPIDNQRVGYIRSSKARVTGDLATQLRTRIEGYLATAEGTQPYLAGHLNKPEHVNFLMDKALRYEAWSSASLSTFVDAFGSLDAKCQRIQDGANYVATVLAHWRQWLHPENPNLVVLAEVNLVKSDLHERGLGVVEVRFTKPVGMMNQQFGAQTAVHAFIKPENKSLEQNLLGAGPNSAFNRINRIAGLTNPNEKLQTIKMESTDNFGTLVEAANGISAEKLWPANTQPTSDKPISQSFHETLVVAFLAGLDDLHMKNVFWDNAGVAGLPTLVDADNVLSRNQMEDVDNGAMTQSGFGKYYNRDEANKNKQAIRNNDNSQIHSKVLNVMLNNQAKRRQIINVLKLAIRGHKGRVVPIRTNYWGQRLRSYPTHPNKDGELTRMSQRNFLVRNPGIDGVGFVMDTGPGLFGVVGDNVTTAFYDPVAERAQTKNDFDAGVIPFYEYEFDTGFVTHNGVTIYNGQTLDQAMTRMLQRFGG